MKIKQENSTEERNPATALRMKQTIQRVFKANSFNSPKFTPNGLTYILCLSGSVPARTSTFPLVFFISSCVLTAKIYFSLDNAAFTSQNQNLIYRIKQFVEIANGKRMKSGRLVVDERKGLVCWEDTLRVKNGSEIEEKLVGFVNEMVKMFAFYIPGLYSLVTAAASCEEACSHLSHPAEQITFLRSQKDLFSSDSDTAAQIGLKFDSSRLLEVNYQEELRIQQSIKETSASDYFAWENVLMEESCASAKFIQPPTFLSFAFFLTHSSGQVSAVLSELHTLVKDLCSNSIYIDDLYERLYVEEGKKVRVNPAVLTGHVKKEMESYAGLWGKVGKVCQEVTYKQQSKITHSELWSKLDCFLKIQPESLYPLENGPNGSFLSTLGSIPVSLVEVNLSGAAVNTIASLSEELYNSQRGHCYGVTSLIHPDTEAITCYLVKDCVL